jgi:hypothetical protein
MKRSRAKPDPRPRLLHFRRHRLTNKLQKRNDFSHGLLFRQSPSVAGLPRTSQHLRNGQISCRRRDIRGFRNFALRGLQQNLKIVRLMHSPREIGSSSVPDAAITSYVSFDCRSRFPTTVRNRLDAYTDRRASRAGISNQ